MSVLLPLLADAADKAAEKSGGFSPLELWHFPSQIAWTLASFAIMYFVLSRFILPKLGNTLETRQSSIASDLDEAQRFSDQADEATKALELRMTEARTSARQTAEAARAKIDASLAAKTAETDAKLQVKLDAAEERIAELRDKAMANVSDITADVTKAITDRFDANVNASDVKSAVAKVLNT
jgi:F-type H+-transporting ATPase subunit b